MRLALDFRRTFGGRLQSPRQCRQTTRQIKSTDRHNSLK
jgi:hypothetical protein